MQEKSGLLSRLCTHTTLDESLVSTWQSLEASSFTAPYPTTAVKAAYQHLLILCDNTGLFDPAIWQRQLSHVHACFNSVDRLVTRMGLIEVFHQDMRAWATAQCDRLLVALSPQHDALSDAKTTFALKGFRTWLNAVIAFFKWLFCLATTPSAAVVETRVNTLRATLEQTNITEQERYTLLLLLGRLEQISSLCNTRPAVATVCERIKEGLSGHSSSTQDETGLAHYIAHQWVRHHGTDSVTPAYCQQYQAFPGYTAATATQVDVLLTHMPPLTRAVLALAHTLVTQACDKLPERHQLLSEYTLVMDKDSGPIPCVVVTEHNGQWQYAVYKQDSKRSAHGTVATLPNATQWHTYLTQKNQWAKTSTIKRLFQPTPADRDTAFLHAVLLTCPEQPMFLTLPSQIRALATTQAVSPATVIAALIPALTEAFADHRRSSIAQVTTQLTDLSRDVLTQQGLFAYQGYTWRQYITYRERYDALLDTISAILKSIADEATTQIDVFVNGQRTAFAKALNDGVMTVHIKGILYNGMCDGAATRVQQYTCFSDLDSVWTQRMAPVSLPPTDSFIINSPLSKRQQGYDAAFRTTWARHIVAGQSGKYNQPLYERLIDDIRTEPVIQGWLRQWPYIKKTLHSPVRHFPDDPHDTAWLFSLLDQGNSPSGGLLPALGLYQRKLSDYLSLLARWAKVSLTEWDKQQIMHQWECQLLEQLQHAVLPNVACASVAYFDPFKGFFDAASQSVLHADTGPSTDLLKPGLEAIGTRYEAGASALLQQVATILHHDVELALHTPAIDKHLESDLPVLFETNLQTYLQRNREDVYRMKYALLDYINVAAADSPMRADFNDDLTVHKSAHRLYAQGYTATVAHDSTGQQATETNFILYPGADGPDGAWFCRGKPPYTGDLRTNEERNIYVDGDQVDFSLLHIGGYGSITAMLNWNDALGGNSTPSDEELASVSDNHVFAKESRHWLTGLVMFFGLPLHTQAAIDTQIQKNDERNRAKTEPAFAHRQPNQPRAAPLDVLDALWTQRTTITRTFNTLFRFFHTDKAREYPKLASLVSTLSAKKEQLLLFLEKRWRRLLIRCERINWPLLPIDKTSEKLTHLLDTLTQAKASGDTSRFLAYLHLLPAYGRKTETFAAITDVPYCFSELMPQLKHYQLDTDENVITTLEKSIHRQEVFFRCAQDPDSRNTICDIDETDNYRTPLPTC